MVDFGAMRSVIENLLGALQSPILQQICTKLQLEKLQESIFQIRREVVNAEIRELLCGAEDWFQQMRVAIYEAEDLADELLTLGRAHLLEHGGRHWFNYIAGSSLKLDHVIKKLTDAHLKPTLPQAPSVNAVRREDIIFSVTRKALDALNSPGINERCSNSQLEDLKQTLHAVREVAQKLLVDAEAKLGKFSYGDQNWIQTVNGVAYEIVDLVDVWLTEEPHLCPHRSQRLEQVSKKLDQIASDRHLFNFRGHCGEKTCCDAEDVVVGRDDELKEVVKLLLESPDNVIAIVGLGGTGKTSLARLAFDQVEFPLKLWVCVSDSRGRPLNVEEILTEMMRSAKECGLPVSPGFYSVENILGQKFLLVLDDLWNENPNYWLQLIEKLPIGVEGSRILVTTRSKETARIVGSLIPYELKGLCQHYSWHLFERVVFPLCKQRGNNQVNPPPEFVELGKQIVQKCFNHPMAIEEAATFLCRQNISTWRSFQERGLAKIHPSPTMLSLKVSYYDMEFRLKSCFSYCALFPLDFVLHKRTLISLWMAQGYIVPLGVSDDMENEDSQNVDDIGEKYFSIFLGRGFFDVVETDELGVVVTCKMHGLMHVLAQDAAEGEIYISNSTSASSSDIICHLFHSGGRTESSFSNPGIRSYLQDGLNQLSVDALVKQGGSLRALDFHGSKTKVLPESITGLLHLRYLDLSYSIELEALPNSIIKLQNLQTLDLRFCALLKELPPEFSRLSKLRCLDMFGCDGITHMPSGMDKLTCLRHLSQFVVAEGISSEKQFFELKDLKKLSSLRGNICILIPRSFTNVQQIDGRGAFLEVHEHLRKVWVRFSESRSVDNSDQRVVNYHQAVLENLQPHRNIMKLVLWGYQGDIISKWGREEDNWAGTLPNLVMIELRSCEKLIKLPLLSEIPPLKHLRLHGLRELEYLEKNATTSSTHVAGAFFPSLKDLEIINAPMLKGFWDGKTIPNCATFPPSLVRIKLQSCEKLQKLPLLSNLSLLKSLTLYGLSNLEGLEKLSSFTISSTVPEQELTFLPNLEELKIVDAPKLRRCWTVVGWSFGDNVAPAVSCFRSLKNLELANLPELRGFFCIEGDDDDHSCTLQFGFLSELRVSNCPKLMYMPLAPTLEALEAIDVHVELLKHLLSSQGFQSSSSTSSTLRKVDIVAVHGLCSVPSCLSNVKSLTIRRCVDLITLDLGDSAYVKRLTIQECSRLKFILPGLNHLSCLEELEIEDCEELDWSMKNNGGEEICVTSEISRQNLRSLRLTNILKCESLIESLSCLTTLEQLFLSWVYKLTVLPEQISHLKQLCNLTIRCCPNLTVLPESLGRLSSLKQLEIECCPRLKQLPASLSTESLQVVIQNCPQLQPVPEHP